jgi:hypothetical protein
MLRLLGCRPLSSALLRALSRCAGGQRSDEQGYCNAGAEGWHQSFLHIRSLGQVCRTFYEATYAAALELQRLKRKLERNSLPEITLIGILFWFDCQSCQRDLNAL